MLRAARYLADKAATGELRALNSANKKSGPSQGEDEVPGATAPRAPFLHSLLAEKEKVDMQVMFSAISKIDCSGSVSSGLG